MGRDISLFSGYNQKENRTTNYCLLLLKQIFEESPKLFANAIENMGCIGIGSIVGVQFRQQERRGGSVPDGLIVQSPFSIFFETKNTDWFYWDQIYRHLSELRQVPGHKILIALANMEEQDTAKFDEFQSRILQEFDDAILFVPLSFEQFIDSIEAVDLPLRLRGLAEELRTYLDIQNLLPNWTKVLDVVNCVTTMHEVDAGVYLCPARAGSYWHSRAKFFGPYRRKAVDRICEILGMVDVVGRGEIVVHYNNGPLSEGDLKEMAFDFVVKFRPFALDQGVRAILLGDPTETHFEKDSKGGMRGTKRFFEVGEGSAPEIARRLKGKTWSEIRGS